MNSEQEEANYALVHWSFETKESADFAASALEVAASFCRNSGKYARVIGPTSPAQGGDFIVGISCQIEPVESDQSVDLEASHCSPESS